MRPLAAALLAIIVVGATPAQPPPPIAALTQTVIDSANANNAAKLSGIYTSDAVVVDENAPYTWRGSNAGVQWFRGVQRAIAPQHLTLHVTGAPVSNYMTDREADDAYVTQGLVIVVGAKGKTMSERGTQTYVFHKSEDGVWKISRQIWTTASSPEQSIAPGTDGPAKLMMSAFNTRSADALAELYTGDATFIDDLSPMVWNGARAGAAWYSEATKYLRANGVSAIHGTVGAPAESKVEGDVGYVIVPVQWSATTQGKAFVQRGCYTMTLRKTNGSWLITSQTWLSAR